MEIGTGLALFGAAKMLEKLLGPTSDYIGEGIKNWTENRINNVKRIFSVAERTLGDKINAKGIVSPKVLKGILNEGSFSDDFLSTEYLGGVLASSRSEVSRDDRGAVFINLISTLSSYQLRAHYIIYRVLYSLFIDTSLKITQHEDRALLKFFIPKDDFNNAMEFDEKENLVTLWPHIFFGLQRHGLIENFWYGLRQAVEIPNQKEQNHGILIIPSVSGVELFLWAFGRSEITAYDFFRTENRFPTLDQIKTSDSAFKVTG